MDEKEKRFANRYGRPFKPNRDLTKLDFSNLEARVLAYMRRGKSRTFRLQAAHAERIDRNIKRAIFSHNALQAIQDNVIIKGTVTGRITVKDQTPHFMIFDEFAHFPKERQPGVDRCLFTFEYYPNNPFRDFRHMWE